MLGSRRLLWCECDRYASLFLITLSLLVVSLGVVLTGTATAQSAPDCSQVSYDGSGTSDDPYQVENVDELQCIEEQGLGVNYTQVSDIDASETKEWNEEDKFTEKMGSWSPLIIYYPEGSQLELTRSPVDELLDTDDLNVELVDSGNGTIELQEDVKRRFNVTYTTEEGIPVGFDPIGDRVEEFTGNLYGNGHKITGIAIDRPTENNIGLFRHTNKSKITSIGLEDAEITGDEFVGGLVVWSVGTVEESYVTGNVSGDGFIGGLIGVHDYGDIKKSYVTGTVSGEDFAGGLIGFNNGGEVRESYATGDVSGDDRVGGLIGRDDGTVNQSYATGKVTGNRWIGGLVGVGGDVSEPYFDSNLIKESYAMGDVSGNESVGGLVGESAGTIEGSYATGSVSGDTSIGGLLGENERTVDESYATGDVEGNSKLGGFVGENNAIVKESYATGEVEGDFEVGGFVGSNYVTVEESYATGDITGTEEVGGLTGRNLGTVKKSYATGNVTADKVVGGLLGIQYEGTTKDSYATGDVTGNTSGGLIGQNGEDAFSFRNGTDGVLRDSYWDTEATGQDVAVGKVGGDDDPDNGTEGGESIIEGEVDGLSKSQMKGDDAPGNMTGFDFTATWETDTNPDDYPTLADVQEHTDNYRNSRGDVDLSGLQKAIDDFINGSISLGLLQEVIDEFVAS